MDGNSTWSPCFSPPPKMKPEQKELSVSMGAPTLRAGKSSFLSFCCASLEWRQPCPGPGLAPSGTAAFGCTRGHQDAMRSLAPRKSSIIAGTASGYHPARAGTLLPCGVLGPQSPALPLCMLQKRVRSEAGPEISGLGLWGLTRLWLTV